MPRKGPEARTAYNKAYYEANKDKIKARFKGYREANKDKIKAYSKSYREANKDRDKHYSLWRMAKARAKKAGVPFGITREYVQGLIDEYGKVCPALGTPFQAGIGRTIPESMTLDRFEPDKGYVEGNCWLLSSKANSIKSSATRTELGRVYRWMCKVIGEQE